MTPLALLALLALLAWLAVLLAPWQPHRTRERLEADARAVADLSDICVLIPARDEAAVIARTIRALRRQGAGLAVIVVDDQSTDGTAEACLRAAREPPASPQARESDSAASGDPPPLQLRVVPGAELPLGWAGKLWALEQGLGLVDRPFALLIDADIELAPGLVGALRNVAAQRRATLVSIMAELNCESLWEKLLAPPFVFFFKLLYPFSLANDPQRSTAAAAGGCMLVRTESLRAIGGFAAIRGALIDDCALAAALKRGGGTIWLGMSHSVRSLRAYTLADFWSMVRRSAFTQLRYSPLWLVAATVLMIGVLLVPPFALALWPAGAASAQAAIVAGLAWLALSAAYWPTVRFYGLPAAWSLTLPVAGALFLAMTWSSALGYWRGTRATWKNRTYDSRH